MRTILLPLAACLGIMLAATAVAQPKEDCSTAAEITTMPYTDAQTVLPISWASGTQVPSCVTSTDNGLARYDVWYRYVPSMSGNLILQANHSLYQTLFTVYTSPDNSCSGLTQVAGGCRYWNPQRFSIPVTAGVAYYIQISKQSSSATTTPYSVTFNFAATPPAPSNAECNTALVIPPVTLATPYVSPLISTFSAGNDSGVDVTCNTAGGSGTALNGVWWSYSVPLTDPVDVTYHIVESDTYHASVISVYRGQCGVFTLLPESCRAGNSSAAGAIGQHQNGSTPFTLQPGWDVKFLVSIGSPQSGSQPRPPTVDDTVRFSLYRPPLPPANDTCLAATPINTLPFSSGPVGIYGATADSFISPSCANNPTANQAFRGVWWTFTSPTSGVVNLAASGTVGSQTVLSVFTGSCTGSLTQVLCARNPAAPVALNAQAGVTYSILISRWDATVPGLLESVTLTATPTSVVCCRGTTCTIVSGAANCITPASPVVGSIVSAASGCGINNNATTGCCFADFNKLGGVTIDDIFIYLNAWFGPSPFADVGGDGTAQPNIDDIFIFLNAWFSGCT